MIKKLTVFALILMTFSIMSFQIADASENTLSHGITLLHKGDYKGSRKLFESHLVKCRKNNDIGGQALTRYWLASLYFETGRYDDSVSQAMESRKLYESLKMKSDVLKDNALIIENYFRQCEYKKARELMEFSEKTLKGDISSEALGNFYLARGLILGFRENRELSLKNLQEALKLFKKNNDGYGEIIAYLRLASAIRQTNPEKEEEYLKAAERKAIELNSRFFQALIMDIHASKEPYNEERAKKHKETAEIFKSLGNRKWEADEYFRLSVVYSQMHDIDKSLSFVDKIIALKREENNTAGLIEAYRRKSIELHILNITDKKRYDEIIDQLKKIEASAKNPEIKAKAVIVISEIMENKGCKDEEIAEMIRKGRMIYESSGDKIEQINCIVKEADSLGYSGKNRESFDLLQKALDLSLSLGTMDRYDYIYYYECTPGNIYDEMATVFRRQGKYPEALEYYQKSLDYNISRKETYRILDNYCQIISAAMNLYDIEKAFASLSNYIKQVPELKDPLREARYYDDITNLLFHNQRKDSLGINYQTDIRDELASLLLERIIRDKDLYNKIKKGYDAWIEYTVKKENKSYEYDARTGYAEFLNIDKNYTEAESQLEIAVKLAKELKDSMHEGKAYSKLSELLISQNKYDKASEAIINEIEAYKKLDDKFWLSLSYSKMAHFLEKIDKKEEAKKYAALAETYREKNKEKKDTADRAFELLYDKKDPDGALTLYKQALEEKKINGDKRDCIFILQHIASIYGRKGDLENEFDCFRKALEIAYEVHDIFWIEELSLTYGKKLERDKRDNEAIDVCKKSVDLVTSQWEFLSKTLGQQKLSKNSNTMMLFDHLIRLLLKSGRYEEAFRYIELSRSLELLNSLKIEELKLPDDTMKNFVEKLRLIREKMYLINKELESTKDEERRKSLSQILATTREEFFVTMNNIKSKNPDFEQLLNVRASDLAALQRIVPPGVLLAEYYPSKDSLFIFEITNSSFLIKKVDIERDKLYETIRRYREEITKPGNTGFEKDKNILYSLLIKPIEEDIASKESLVIVPGGLLWYLPFETLGPVTGDYLITKKNVSYLSSAHVLNMMLEKRKMKDKPDRLLLIGAPPGSGLSGAEKELEGIASIFPEHIIFSGKDSTKDNFTKNAHESSIIHIASHSVLNRENINDSFIQMADSRLTIGEIYSILLPPSSIVILSSCESMLGEDNPGGEFAGLASTFTTAGASSIIASEWKVDDLATSSLFINFYRNLKGNKPKGEALRLAKLKLINKPETAHPFYWGGFILLGDWR